MLFPRGERSVLKNFWIDVVLAWRMAANDIKQRYRGSTLGPIWLTISMLVTAASIAVVYSVIFRVPYRDYLIYLIVGMSVWAFISSLIMEATTSFIISAGIIKNMQMSLIVHLLRLFYRNVIILLHNAVAIVFILAITQAIHPLGFVIGSFGAVLDGLVLFPYILIISFVGARYRDIPQVVANLLQFAMLITPIYWFAKAAGPRSYLAAYNPFFHMVEVFRAPMLGDAAKPTSYLVLLVIGLVGAAVSYLVFRTQRRNVPFWI